MFTLRSHRDCNLVLGLVLSCLFTAFCTAQSLDADKPFPMKAGSNRGTIDSFVGPHYFYFWAGPGESTVTVTYRSMTLFGAKMRSGLNVELSDEKKSWTTRKEAISTSEPGKVTFPGNLKERTKVIVALIPPSGTLIRTGGDYEVEVTGAVNFDPQPSAADLVAGVYSPKVIHENEDTAVKFSSDGTLEFASGTQGRWKLFDASNRIFTVTYRGTRLSLKLIPGRGLVQTDDVSLIVFQKQR